MSSYSLAIRLNCVTYLLTWDKRCNAFPSSTYMLQGSNQFPVDNRIKFPQKYRVWFFSFYVRPYHRGVLSILKRNFGACNNSRQTYTWVYKVIILPLQFKMSKTIRKLRCFSTARTNLNLKCQCKDYSGRDMPGNEIHCLSNPHTEYKLQFFCNKYTRISVCLFERVYW